jgi:5' nucleotidase, deoxy (Pyrimidine), cytosolic type C protein (NT5C)
VTAPLDPFADVHLGLDVDGVLANFTGDGTHGFSAVLALTSGRKLFPAEWTPTSWHWWGVLGYKKSEAEAAWDYVHRGGLFWQTLKPYEGVGPFLHELTRLPGLRVTFLTTRAGKGAHAQTLAWLAHYGAQAPQVQLCPTTDSKGRLAHALGLTAFVDDYMPNVQAVMDHNPRTIVKLYARLWNAQDQMPGATVKGLDELLAFVRTLLARRDAAVAALPDAASQTGRMSLQS